MMSSPSAKSSETTHPATSRPAPASSNPLFLELLREQDGKELCLYILGVNRVSARLMIG